MGELAQAIRPNSSQSHSLYNIQSAKISHDLKFLHTLRHLGSHKVTFYVDSNINFGHSTARANLPFRIQPFAV